MDKVYNTVAVKSHTLGYRMNWKDSQRIATVDILLEGSRGSWTLTGRDMYELSKYPLGKTFDVLFEESADEPETINNVRARIGLPPI